MPARNLFDGISRVCSGFLVATVRPDQRSRLLRDDLSGRSMTSVSTLVGRPFVPATSAVS